MKKIVFLLLISAFLLTSCMTAVKTKEVIEDVKEPVTEEKEETPETPDVPEEPKVPVTPETTLDPDEVQEPDTKDVVDEQPEIPVDGDAINPDENETSAIQIDFKEVTEEELQNIFEAINGGEPIDFPVIPIE